MSPAEIIERVTEVGGCSHSRVWQQSRRMTDVAEQTHE